MMARIIVIFLFGLSCYSIARANDVDLSLHFFPQETDTSVQFTGRLDMDVTGRIIGPVTQTMRATSVVTNKRTHETFQVELITRGALQETLAPELEALRERNKLVEDELKNLRALIVEIGRNLDNRLDKIAVDLPNDAVFVKMLKTSLSQPESNR